MCARSAKFDMAEPLIITRRGGKGNRAPRTFLCTTGVALSADLQHNGRHGSKDRRDIQRARSCVAQWCVRMEGLDYDTQHSQFNETAAHIFAVKRRSGNGGKATQNHSSIPSAGSQYPATFTVSAVPFHLASGSQQTAHPVSKYVVGSNGSGVRPRRNRRK